MKEVVIVYGFGSMFRNIAVANDIDLLIVHLDTDLVSCEFAIQCKRRLMERLICAHVTLLSASEEERFRFIASAQARRIGTVRRDYIDLDIENVLIKILYSVHFLTIIAE